ncbi:hypothetical protein BDR03DRAFT_962620, partial [Suillus americanus]
MKAKDIRSPVETWLHFLRYYLDASHSDLMRDAAELIEKYGEEGFHEMDILPGLEHYPAAIYHTYADDYFLSILEAAEGEEFILTHNSVGLWEGLASGYQYPPLHRIFVVSPRVAIVMCSVVLLPDVKEYTKPGSFNSRLLNLDPTPPIPIYPNGEHLDYENFVRSFSRYSRYKSLQEGGVDLFVLKITKLTRPQTLEVNSVVLLNVKDTGSLTFQSSEKMLRTARAFRSSPSNIPKSDLIVALIAHLASGSVETEVPALRPPLQSPAAVPDEDFDPSTLVDVVLYVLPMQICTGHKRFSSSYDRAHLLLRIMEKSKPTSFADEINREVEKAFTACKGDSEDGISSVEGVSFDPLLSSIPNESSSRLFRIMVPYMSRLGAVMFGGEGIFGELQDEVAVVSFLQRASCSPGVWHTLSCSSPDAPEILSRLFNMGTRAERIM